MTFDDDGNPSNNPDQMKRHRPWVQFHHPDHQKHENNTLHHDQEVEDHITDPKIMKTLLGHLSKTKERNNQINSIVETTTKDHIHKHRDQTVNQDEMQFLTIKEAQANKGNENSEELFQNVLKKLKGLGDKGQKVLERLKEHLREDDDDNVKGMLSDALKESDIDPLIETKGRQWNKNRIHYEDNIEENNRKKRQISIEPALEDMLNEHDEKGDAAIEEVSILI